MDIKSIRNYKNLIYTGIFFCIIILLAFYIKNLIRERERLEQFNGEVLALTNTSTTTTREDNQAMLDLAKLTDRQNKNATYDRTIDESQLGNSNGR
jgi:hypothetical protein